jgi:hypothetical protein
VVTYSDRRAPSWCAVGSSTSSVFGTPPTLSLRIVVRRVLGRSVDQVSQLGQSEIRVDEPEGGLGANRSSGRAGQPLLVDVTALIPLGPDQSERSRRDLGGLAGPDSSTLCANLNPARERLSSLALGRREG